MAECPHCGQVIPPPPCPECRGSGFVTNGGCNGSAAWVTSRPCPRGCPPPVIINTHNTGRLYLNG